MYNHSDNEKRQFFRIEQDVVFNFHTVSNDDVTHTPAAQHFEHTETLCLFSELQYLEERSSELLASIKQENPVIAEYLSNTNKKIDLICQQVLSNQSSVHDLDSGKIDISLGGLGFQHERPIGIESWIAFKLIFLPSYTGVIGYAQVTRNMLQANGSYLVGVRFHNLRDDQSKVIAREIFNTQVSERHKHYYLQH